MKDLFRRLFLTVAVAAVGCSVAAAETADKAKLRLTVVSFNIRRPSDKAPNDWEHRKVRVIRDLRRLKPDVFGLQEATSKQIAALKVLGYRHIGHGRERNLKGEATPVFYDPRRFELVEERTVWLSRTPRVFSLAEGADMPRIVTLGVFREKHSGREFVFASTHLHHRNQKVCHPEQIRAVLDELTPYVRRGMTVILTGDFNSSPAGIAPKETAKLLRDSYLVSEAKPVQPEPCTFHGFAPPVRISASRRRKPRIDYIWVTPDVRVLRYESVNNFDDHNLASSDHYPQLAEVEF
jgi:endonuclease/exonuclease/phosphatase family metal-dependent hydrolase